MTKYAYNKDDYPYLTDAQRSAAKTALIKYNDGNSSLTEDEQQLYRFGSECKNTGWRAGYCKDGLLCKSKETSDEQAGYTGSGQNSILCGDLDNIEAEDFQGATSSDCM